VPGEGRAVVALAGRFATITAPTIRLLRLGPCTPAMSTVLYILVMEQLEHLADEQAAPLMTVQALAGDPAALASLAEQAGVVSCVSDG
jgi:hypothetical protein